MLNKSRIFVSAVLALSLCACGRKGASAADTGAAAGDAAGGKVTPAAPVPLAASTLGDANIVVMLDNANKLDSIAGSVASTKGTSSEVRDFGKKMMTDHHGLRLLVQDLIKRLGVSPTAAPSADMKARTDKTMALLNGATKGKDFDKAYIDNEVTYHKALLESLIAAMGAADNSELKNVIQKAAPAFLAHLDLAESVQSKMK
ncbi:MAG: DUF4142 domain-containing protein [Gemmatimonadaceae bacterium]